MSEHRRTKHKSRGATLQNTTIPAALKFRWDVLHRIATMLVNKTAQRIQADEAVDPILTLETVIDELFNHLDDEDQINYGQIVAVKLHELIGGGDAAQDFIDVAFDTQKVFIPEGVPFREWYNLAKTFMQAAKITTDTPYTRYTLIMITGDLAALLAYIDGLMRQLNVTTMGRLHAVMPKYWRAINQ